jgi:tetratricopeptide (TPR) repeat protein
MFRYFFRFVFLVLLLSGTNAFSQKAQDEQLANHYFQSGEFDKAILLYEKLYDKKPEEGIFKNYLQSLLAMKGYDKAEKICKKQLKRFPDNPKYFVDLGTVYQQSGQLDKATSSFEKAIKSLKKDQQQIFDLATAFIAIRKFEFAAATYLAGRKMDKSYPYNFELAEVYYLNKDYPNMINEYLDLLLQSESYIQNIQSSLQTKLSDDPTGTKNEMLRIALLKHVQRYPDKPIFSEMLFWVFVQQKDFESALIQAKALDKRLKEDGSRLISLANLCLSNEDYDAAINTYQYLISKGVHTPYYLTARVEMLNTANKKMINNGKFTKEDLLHLEEEYNTTLKELGKNQNTVSLVKGLAHLQAFYLNKTGPAIAALKECIEIPNTPKNLQAECKLELADIYLITGEVWESTLLYSQVDKAFKGSPLGEEAKFRNARLSYYKGEFEWARGQLDVLKGGTSHLIANDALKLSLLIQDNMGLDSNISALLVYAHADLLLFQNKDDEALRELDSLLLAFPKHSLTDEVLLKKSEIMKKKQRYEEEAALLQTIVELYPSDILADDALFTLADLYEKKLNNKQKAMDLYQDLLVKYPGSTFGVAARKRFRTLRGDVLN